MERKIDRSGEEIMLIQQFFGPLFSLFYSIEPCGD